MILLAISLWATVFVNRTFSSLILPGLDAIFRMNLLVFVCCLHLALYLLVIRLVARASLDQEHMNYRERSGEAIRRINVVGVVVLGDFIL